MINLSKKMKCFYLIVACFLIIAVSLGSYIFYKKPTYKLVNERITENYTTRYNNNTYTGVLYEQDILYKGKLASEQVEEYVLSVKTPLDVNIVEIKFYDLYDENKPSENLQYKIRKIVD